MFGSCFRTLAVILVSDFLELKVVCWTCSPWLLFCCWGRFSCFHSALVCFLLRCTCSSCCWYRRGFATAAAAHHDDDGDKDESVGCCSCAVAA